MQRPPRTQRPYRQQTTHRSATSRPPPGESAASATPTPVGLSPSFVRITLPGNTRLDKVRGIPLTGMESGSIPWKVPEAGPGHAIVMLETLETVAVPAHCLQVRHCSTFASPSPSLTTA